MITPYRKKEVEKMYEWHIILVIVYIFDYQHYTAVFDRHLADKNGCVNEENTACRTSDIPERTF